ncbi:M23 family metallopeptidase OS=Streptomyces tendae OX=1932 GN=GUR47_22190 PE=4 SV=1 [Streptomyces tendae]
MASNRPAPEAPVRALRARRRRFGYDSYRTKEGPWEEWNPTADSIRPVRGRHRVAKQRGGLAAAPPSSASGS